LTPSATTEDDSMLSPRQNETKREFIARCDSDAAMRTHYAGYKNRRTAALQLWDDCQAGGPTTDSTPADAEPVAETVETSEETRAAILAPGAADKLLITGDCEITAVPGTDDLDDLPPVEPTEPDDDEAQ